MHRKKIAIHCNLDVDAVIAARSRKIFSLSRFEGLKYHEIAKKLSLSVKTIESNMGKALKLFRKNIKAYLETT